MCLAMIAMGHPARVRAGRTRCCRASQNAGQPPWRSPSISEKPVTGAMPRCTSALPATGSHSSHTANPMMSKMPSQNVGIEMPTKPQTMLRLSRRLRGRNPAIVPTSMPIGTATTIDASASSSVAGRRRRISRVTLAPVRYDRPRSPRTALTSHRPYWTGQGSARPISRRIRSTASTEPCNPKRSDAGSPPAVRTITNVTIDTSSRLGTTISTRRRRYEATLTSLRRSQPPPAVDGLSVDHGTTNHQVAEWPDLEPLDRGPGSHGTCRIAQRDERAVLQDESLGSEVHVSALLGISLDLRRGVQLVDLGILIAHALARS